MTLEEQLGALIDSAPAHIQRHFACDCAERVLKAANVRDKRLWSAIEVSRLFAEGKATIDELDAAWSAARSAAESAAESERTWQLTHLQHLLAAHNTARSSLLSVLQQRAESVQTALPRNKEALEEALFT